jgi:hypothetical protein
MDRTACSQSFPVAQGSGLRGPGSEEPIAKGLTVPGARCPEPVLSRGRLVAALPARDWSM